MQTICCNGDTFNWTVKAINPSNHIATNVVVNNVFNSGSLIKSSSVNIGTFDEVTGIWTIPSLPANSTMQLNLVMEVYDKDQLPFTLVSTISADQLDTQILDNTDTENVTLGINCPACETPYPVTDLGCICGDVSINDTPCGGVTSTRYRVVAGSEVNLDSVALDEVTGVYFVVISNMTQAWEFQYNMQCEVNGVVTASYGPTTVSGPILTTCETFNSCETVTVVTDNGDGTYTYVNEAGNPFTIGSSTALPIFDGDPSATIAIGETYELSAGNIYGLPEGIHKTKRL